MRLIQHQGRWASIKPTLNQRIVFAGDAAAIVNTLLSTLYCVCIHETLPQCWATDYDNGPALNKHVVKVVCLQWTTALISRLTHVYNNCREKTTRCNVISQSTSNLPEYTYLAAIYLNIIMIHTCIAIIL